MSVQKSSGINVLAGTVSAPFFAGNGVALSNVTASSVAAAGVRPGSVVVGAIVDADINASAAIAPSKIAGTAAVLGANTYTGAQTLPGTPHPRCMRPPSSILTLLRRMESPVPRAWLISPAPIPTALTSMRPIWQAGQ
ncbi:MAG: hypothetical protein AAB359_00565 [Elusimicrobiota bacterium]